MKIIQEGKITWIDIENPKPEDINYLRSNFSFHQIVLDELIPSSARSKIEHYDSYMFAVIHLPIFSEKKQAIRAVELDVLLTKTHVITVHQETIHPLNDFISHCEGSTREKIRCFGGTGILFYWMLEAMFKYYLKELHIIAGKIDGLENKIFASVAKSMLEEISFAKREILDFRRVIKPQHSILISLVGKGSRFFGEELRIYFDDLVGDFTRVWDILENYKETIDALEESHSSLLSFQLNKTMQVLTIFTALFIPISVIAGIFSMSMVSSIPFFNSPKVFLSVIVVMIASSIGLFAIFKKRGWI
ncbi:MAG: magnesium transporter CorA family protein [Parcubacteria group bacterium]|nr:magnesium transporter CorA family protein [Parcubacteria group bacterium]